MEFSEHKLKHFDGDFELKLQKIVWRWGNKTRIWVLLTGKKIDIDEYSGKPAITRTKENIENMRLAVCTVVRDRFYPLLLKTWHENLVSDDCLKYAFSWPKFIVEFPLKTFICARRKRYKLSDVLRMILSRYSQDWSFPTSNYHTLSNGENMVI